MLKHRSACATRKSRRESGSALLLCVVVLFILMSIGGSTLSVGLMQKAAARRGIEVDEASAIAEAGVDRALFELDMNTDFGANGIGVTAGGLGPGTFTTTLIPAFVGPGDYTIRSTATVNGVQRTVEAVVAQAAGNGIGFFGRDSITLSSSLVDTYNSATGTYASQVVGGHAGTDVHVVSNGGITVSGSGQVWGDATPGPGFTVNDPTKVSGSTAPATVPTVPDPYVYSPVVASMGVWNGSGSMGPGVFRYTTLTVSSGVLTLNGQVELWVDDKFTLSGGSQIILTPGSSVVIHHGANDMKISGGGLVNQTLIPDKVRIYSSTVKKVEFSGSSNFYGVIHAPDAEFVGSGGSGIFGSVVAKKMTISGGTALHFDKWLVGGADDGFDVLLVRPVWL